MDSYATHKTRRIRDGLAKRPRGQVQVTPSGASWINQVERSLPQITDKQTRRGVHTSVQMLEDDIRTFIQTHNTGPKPVRWTKSADGIRASIERFCLRNTKPAVTSDSGQQPALVFC